MVYRKKNNRYEVFLIHPGGPIFENKDDHSWSIPKGLFDESETAFEAALREFEEETGKRIDGEFQELMPVKQKSGEVVYAWAVESDIDETNITSNIFKLEWPPKSGNIQEFPEADTAEWFSLDEAKEKNARQIRPDDSVRTARQNDTVGLGITLPPHNSRLPPVRLTSSGRTQDFAGPAHRLSKRFSPDQFVLVQPPNKIVP